MIPAGSCGAAEMAMTREARRTSLVYISRLCCDYLEQSHNTDQHKSGLDLYICVVEQV